MSGLLSYLERPQYGAGGVHEEESQVTENIGKGKQALSHQDGMVGVPVLPLCVPHILELQSKQTHSETCIPDSSKINYTNLLSSWIGSLPSNSSLPSYI